jgi:hypothetical protein
VTLAPTLNQSQAVYDNVTLTTNCSAAFLLFVAITSSPSCPSQGNKMSMFYDYRAHDKQPDHVSVVEPPKLVKSEAIIHFETDDPQNSFLHDWELPGLA